MISLYTPDLLMRFLRVEDATQGYADWLNDAEVNRFLETRYSIHTIESCRRFITSCEEDPNSSLFGIFLREDSSHIGNAKLGFIDPIHRRGQVSLVIGEKKCWGKGYAKQVIKAISEFGFGELGLVKIEAGCYEGNVGSLRAFLACGYSVEGFLRGHAELDGQRQGCFALGAFVHEIR